MTYSNKILFTTVIIVWISIVFKDETFFSGVDGKGGRGGGGRGGSRGGGSRSGSFFRGGGSTFRMSRGHRSGYTPIRPVVTAQLQNEANNKMKNLAAKIAITGAMVPVVGSVFFHSSNRYAYRSGYYYDYDYRSEYSQLNGSICVNNQTYDGIIYGQFVCPIEGFQPEDILCCGTEGDQFCCGESREFAFGGIIVIVTGLLIIVGFISFNLFYNHCKPLFQCKKVTNEPLLT